MELIASADLVRLFSSINFIFCALEKVAEDECRHFLLLESRLKELGSHYGALSAHDGLWESASHTSHR